MSASGGSPYLNPKLITVTLVATSPSSANCSCTFVASWWMLSSVVSMTKSLISRSSAMRARSAVIPSSSVPLP